MSEYQYYEFVAIDRPLSNTEMAELRKLSSRAEITPTRFTNEYHFGSFRGDPRKMMWKYFDAHVYFANWGTHQFLVRLPKAVLEASSLTAFDTEMTLNIESKDDHTLIQFYSESEDYDYEDEESDWMGSLSGIRSELLSGDFRSLYIAWLADLQFSDIEELEDEKTLEPPVPAGLRSLTASQESLADFLRLDRDLFAVAATMSAPASKVAAGPSDAEMTAFLSSLSAKEKDAVLLSVLKGDATGPRYELLRRFREAQKPLEVAKGTARRPAAQLLTDARDLGELRKRQENERKTKAAERKRREAAAAREKYLDELAGRADRVWTNVDALIEARQKAGYEKAVDLLKDLRDLSDRAGNLSAFAFRVAAIRAKHMKKSNFIEQLDKARLAPPPPTVG